MFSVGKSNRLETHQERMQAYQQVHPNDASYYTNPTPIQYYTNPNPVMNDQTYLVNHAAQESQKTCRKKCIFAMNLTFLWFVIIILYVMGGIALAFDGFYIQGSSTTQIYVYSDGLVFVGIFTQSIASILLVYTVLYTIFGSCVICKCCCCKPWP